MPNCKSGHTYDGLACIHCAQQRSQQEQLRIAEALLASGHRAHPNGQHFSLGRDDWKRLFNQYGWSQSDANVPALCGATLKLSDMDVKKEPENGTACECERCREKVREFVR